MTVTRVSRTKRSSDCAVGTLEFEFKEDSRNGRVSDWLRKICFRDTFSTKSLTETMSKLVTVALATCVT